MSFMDYYGKPYLKETRQEQFIRYLNDTGATKALQDALILLYRMPIKPSNLTKYFAEYFDNGAKKTVALSLLRAELCYKHSQTQSMHKRLAFLEDQIRQLSPHDAILQAKSTENDLTKVNDDNNVPGHENFRLTLDEEGGSSSLVAIKSNMLNRFLDDLDGAPRGSVADTASSSRQSLFGGATTGGKESSNASFQVIRNNHRSSETLGTLEDSQADQQQYYPLIQDDSTLSVYSQTGVINESCTKEVEKDTFKTFQEDVKRLDPWGIVYRTPKRASQNTTTANAGTHYGPDFFEELSKPDLHVDLSVISDHRSSAESEIEYKNYDSDDLETLAEIYQNQAVVEDILEIPEDPSKAKILSVLSPPLDHSNLSSILGWNPIVNEDDSNEPQGKTFPEPYHCEGKANYCESKKINSCKQRNVFWPFENSYSGESPFKPTPDDSFLLKSKGRGGWGDNADESQDFMSEFYQRHSVPATPKELEAVCTKCCGGMEQSRISVNREGKRVTVRQSNGKLMQDEITMTVPDGDCPCAPNKCDCDADCMPIKRSQIFGSRGTMLNWTRYSKEYPECIPHEGYLLGEGETLGEDFERCVQEYKQAKKSEALQQKFNEDFAVPLSPVKSECLCNDGSSRAPVPPEILNQCAEFYRQQNEDMEAAAAASAPGVLDLSPGNGAVEEAKGDGDNANNPMEYSNHGTMTLTDEQVLYEMIQAQRRKSSLEKEAELAKVFQDPDVYEGNTIIRRQSFGRDEERRPTTITVQGDGENVTQEIRSSTVPKRGSDAYELLDLDKEVRKTFGI